MSGAHHPLRVRWLGRVPYREALALQTGLFERGSEQQHLLLLEHPHVFTYGRTADLANNLLCEPADVGAELVPVKRGGDITYHGPGQLVGYPILTVSNRLGASAHVCAVEQLVIDALTELGVRHVGRLPDFPGVWVDPDGPVPRKICAIGVRLAHGRTMHGFGLNVHTDLTYMREHIVPCGIGDRPVTSIAEEGVDVTMKQVVDVVARLAAQRWTGGEIERQDVVWVTRPEDLSAFSRGEGAGAPVRTAADHGVPAEPVLESSVEPSAQPVTFVKAPSARMENRLAAAGVSDRLGIADRKPEWLRPKVVHGPAVLELRRTVRDLRLTTVCEEAGCPNLSECWADGTATFMVLGERCTRACGFCLVDTRKPLEPEADEPDRVAEAVVRMGVSHAVLTMVARDDLGDGGMAHVAACIRAIRDRSPDTRIETLVSDVRGDEDSMRILFDARPDVMNHNVETVPRLQRAVRPSAAYSRSLAMLARSAADGLVTKSGLVVGMGETDDEIIGVLTDLASIGVSIVTIGQYLRPTSNHLPVARWVHPDAFSRFAEFGRSLGIAHVEASPLTRSSYHARQSAEAAAETSAEITSANSALAGTGQPPSFV